MTRLTTWKLSDSDVPRTSLRKIRMSRSGFGLIPRTWPGVLKILKTGQRARSYVGRDPGHLLPSEIGRCRAPQLKITRPKSRPSSIHILLAAYSCEMRIGEDMLRLQGLGTYTDDQIMAMVRRGKRRGYIPGVGKVLAGRVKDILDVPLFTQLQSQHESGSDAAGDDESGDDEDADEDEEDADS
ncbi:hypothetical protein Tco_0646836 [Tanacetum coccineum]